MGILGFNTIGMGIPAMIANYNEHQKHIPKPLASDVAPSSAPAADATHPDGKAQKLSPDLKDQLAEERDQQLKGRPRDARHVKLLERRNENQRIYENADGSKAIEYSAQATSYKDDQGQWKDVDASLEQDGNTGKWRTKANSWKVTFGDILDEGVQVHNEDKTVTFKPDGAKSVKPVVTGKAPHQIVTYRNVWQGIDIQYALGGSELKETIVIKSRVAQSDFDFDVVGAGLAPDSSRTGAMKLDGAFSDFTIAAPSVGTFDKGVVGSEPLVSQTIKGEKLHISLDADWLKKQDFKAFPIALDPTLITRYSITGNWYRNFKSDGYICDPGMGCGNSTGIASGQTWRFAYHVDMSNITTAGYLVSANLHLEMPDPDGVHYWGTYGSQPITVEHASCMNSINCVDAGYGVASGSAAYSGEIDVTNIYRSAFAANDSGVWMMVAGNESGGETYKLFAVDMTRVTFNMDQLPGQSTIASGAPADNGISISTQPALKSTVPSDSDGPGPLQYRYIVGTTKNVPASNPNNILPSVTGIVADSGLSTLPQWNVPDNVLQDGTTYYWQASVWDSYANSPQVYGPVYSFKVDLRNGKDSTQAFDTVGAMNVDLATGNLTTGTKTHSIAALGGSLGAGLDYNSPQRSRAGLVGQFWNDPGATRTFPTSTPAALTRVDPNVDFNWGTNSPSAGVVSSDNFLARWSGYFIAPQAGTYQFGSTSDDGSRIYISNTLNLDQWSSNPVNQYGTSVTLSAGQIVTIKYELAEWSGVASGQLLVKTTDGSISPQVIPSTWLQTGVRPVAAPHGLIGHYYTDDGSHTFPSNPADPTRSFLTRTDTSANLNWGDGSPVPNGPVNNFMVRWTGYFTAPITDTYTFGAGTDDGVKVYLNGSGTPSVNSWSDHSSSPVVYASSGMPLSQGQTIPITVEYYEHTGGAQMALFVKQASLSSAPDTIVDSTWLSPQAQILPDGWSLADGSGAKLSYDFATIAQNSVVLRDSTGQTHEYKWTGSGYTPPANEAGHMLRNGDGTITLQDADGITYVFNTDGTIKTVSMPVDDLHPAALQYTYSGTPARLTQITDGVSSGRWAKLHFWGDSGFTCPTASGFNNSPQTGLLCQVETSDGSHTNFYYSSENRLARLEKPGSEFTDYGYDTLGRIVSTRDSMAYDVVAAAGRDDDDTVRTQVAYDSIGRVSSVTLPAANNGDTRQAHSYEYQLGYTKQHVTNATEPNGFSRKVTYDSTYRTADDTDVANLTAHIDWDTAKDLILATTDPAGLKSTTLYDFNDRPTDQYGPAPSAWFGTDRKPSTSPTDYTNQIPHKQTGYDESINGLATAYYDVDTYTNGTGSASKVLFGAPRLHATGIGPSNGDVVKSWGSSQPITPSQNIYGWGARLTGDVHFTANGNYTFRVQSDDGVRLWVDDTLVIDDWNDGTSRSHGMVSGYTGFNNTSDSWHRVRLDYYNKAQGTTLDTDGTLTLYMTAPGGSETSSLASLLKPLYGLSTSQTTYDSQLGNATSTTNYGANPELSLAQSSSLDPTGLNLTGSASYESQGASGSYLRQLSKTLPGGGTTNYAYYSGAETRQNPCNTSQTFKQAGMLKTKTEADPDGAGSQVGRVQETVYDDAGRIIATRYNSDSWTCTSYDSRGRVTQVAIPAFNGQAARTVTNTWVMYGDPLVVQTSDASGDIQTKSDLLGRISRYVDALGETTDYAYDSVGRLTTKASPMGTETFVYDNYNRLTQHKLDGTIYASVSYDSYGRVNNVAYPTAGSLALAVSRDSLGRVSGDDYTLGNGTTHLTDSVTRSQSGQIMSGTELGASKSYTYDKAGRLTAATIGTHSYSYNFDTPTACSGTYNANAGKNGNRTSQTIDGVTQTYCYDYADRLIQSSNPNIIDPAYDTHGNIINMGNSWSGKYTQFTYDSSDRNIGIVQNWGDDYDIAFNRDAQNRIMSRFETGLRSISTWYGFTGPGDAPSFTRDASWAITEKYLKLPGGVLLTIRPNATPSANQKIFSLPNVHGDVMATTNATGAQIATFQYDPFGNAASTPNNTQAGTSFGWVGQHQKDSEVDLALRPIQMGARVYIPSIGRFTQIDPIDGGVDNAYIYPANPITNLDLTGENMATEALNGIGADANNLNAKGGVDALMFTIGVACIATGVGAVVCGGAAVAGIGLSAAMKYNSSGQSFWAAGRDAAVGGGFWLIGGPLAKYSANKAMGYVAPTIAKRAAPQVSNRAISRTVVTVKQRVQNTIGYAAATVDYIRSASPVKAAPTSTTYLKAVNNLVLSLLGW